MGHISSCSWWWCCRCHLVRINTHHLRLERPHLPLESQPNFTRIPSILIFSAWCLYLMTRVHPVEVRLSGHSLSCFLRFMWSPDIYEATNGFQDCLSNNPIWPWPIRNSLTCTLAWWGWGCFTNSKKSWRCFCIKKYLFQALLIFKRIFNLK